MSPTNGSKRSKLHTRTAGNPIHGNSKPKTPKKNQLLISRFFASSPAAASSEPSRSLSEPSSQKSKQKVQTTRNPSHPSQNGPTIIDGTILVGNSDAADVPGSQHSTQPPADLSSHPSSPPPPTAASSRLIRASQKTNAELSPKPLPVTTPRRRRRLVDIDEDEDSGSVPCSPPSKRTRSAGASAALATVSQLDSVVDVNGQDFGVDADEEDDNDPHNENDKHNDEDADFEPDRSVGDEDSDAMSRDGAEEENSNSTSDKHSETISMDTDIPAVTLASFSHASGAPTVPRDEKKHRRFINRLARLETDNFFSRYPGKAAFSHGNEQAGNGSNGENMPTKKNRNVKYTPLETQYVRLRAKHPNMLLVVECGYKYRLFDNDAASASKVLRIASYVDHNFLTASFPTHRLAHHVARLVDAGHKVGVVAQSETAALKKAGENSSKLFERTLSAVYTKGTIAADGKLLIPGSASRSTSHIMAVSEVREERNGLQTTSNGNKDIGIVMAAVDCTTGDVVYDGFLDDILRSDLESRLVAIEPVELIIPSKSLSKQTESVLKIFAENENARVERTDDKLFKSSADVTALNDAVTKSIGDPGGLICQGILQCIGALVGYLKAFELEVSLTRVRGFKTFRSGGHMRMGADVLRNFEVFGNSNNGGVEGSLFGLVNRAHTPFGKRQMRKWVAQPLTDPAEIRVRLDAVQYLRDLVDTNGPSTSTEGIEKALVDLVMYFVKIPDVERGLMRISCGKCAPSEVVRLVIAMGEVGKRTDQIKWRNPPSKFPSLLKEIVAKAPVVSKIMESPAILALNHEAAEKDNYRQLFEGGDLSIPELFDGIEVADAFVQCVQEVEEAKAELIAEEGSMEDLLKKLKKKHSSPKWVWKKVGQDEYLLEVEKSKASSMPKAWTIICETKSVKRFRPDVAEDGYQRVLCAREKLDAVCKRCWKEYVEILVSAVSQLRGLVRMLADIDCLAALSRVSLLPGYNKPAILDANDSEGQLAKGGLKSIGARHALTENLSSCTAYVPNDVHVGVGTSIRGIVISGPNYGGKSSYARMTALLAMLAQIGSYVPAESLEIRPFDAIYARMGASDCMAKGMSSLMVELAETSRILSEASSRSLVILDELGRGTSTHDGAAIAYATMTHLVREIQCVTIFVTHYPMLAGLRSVFPEWVDACYMDYKEESDDDDVKRKRIVLLYKITHGVAPSSYGLNVARLAGIPLSVLDEALQRASALQSDMERQKRDNRWASVLSTSIWNSADGLTGALRHGRIEP